MTVGSKLVRGFHKTLDPLSMLAYGASTYEYLGLHSIPHAALAIGAGAILTAAARMGEHYLNRNPVDKDTSTTSKTDVRIAKSQAKSAAKKHPLEMQLAKFERQAAKFKKKTGESVTEFDAAIATLKEQIANDSKSVVIQSPIKIIPTSTQQPVTTQPMPDTTPSPVGERHKH